MKKYSMLIFFKHTVCFYKKRIIDIFLKTYRQIDERLEGNDAKEILKVIGEYSKVLDLLDDYDHRTLKKIQGNVDTRKIEYQECIF